MNKTEAREYLIPIPVDGINPDSKWQQSCEIPTIHTELTIPGAKNPITYLRFETGIVAGGENLEITGRRIRVQMIHMLETSQDLLQRPDPPPGLVAEIQAIRKYFTENADSSGSNAQHAQ